MVQLQLGSLDQLRDSCFGRPFPHHGLQLLFWFSNDCVTFESDDVMKLVSDCQPESGLFGFHVFGNVEQLLPALKKRRNKTRVLYFEVGNLNTESYPASADLPAYVRENYGLAGNYGDDNSDRIIISYQARSRHLEAVYVTQHDGDAFGRFRADRTFQICCHLIRDLQDQRLDVTSLLRLTGYYDDTQQPSDHFFSGGFHGFMEAFSYDQRWSFKSTPSSRAVKPRRTRTKRKTRAVTSSYREPYWEPYREPYWENDWEPYWEQSYSEPKKKNGGGRGGGGGGLGLIRILLGAGFLYLAFRCLRSWMRSCWESVLRVNPWRVEGGRMLHVMLDYIF